MCDKNDLNRLENSISDCRIMLYDIKAFIKFGALASESAIIDDSLQLNKDFNDYYILLRTIDQKLEKAIKALGP